MPSTDRVKQILSWYGSDNPGTKANLYRMLMTGTLAGTGKLVILPVDQAQDGINPAAGWDPAVFSKIERRTLVHLAAKMADGPRAGSSGDPLGATPAETIVRVGLVKVPQPGA